MKRFLFLLPVLFLPAFVHAQVAADMDLLLNSDVVSFSQASRFVLSAAEILPEDAKEIDAFREALSRKWIAEGINPSDQISLEALSLLCMRAFNIPGGMMYSIFPIKRYAYREMVYKHFIQGKTDPSQKMNGSQFILILGRVLSFVGDDV